MLLYKDLSIYTGITNDLNNRLKAHTEGEGAKYTKGRGPFILIYQEDFQDRSASTKREIEIKKLNKKQKLELAENN